MIYEEAIVMNIELYVCFWLRLRLDRDEKLKWFYY